MVHQHEPVAAEINQTTVITECEVYINNQDAVGNDLTDTIDTNTDTVQQETQSVSEESTSVTETDTESEEQAEPKQQKLENDGIRKRGGADTYSSDDHQSDSDEGDAVRGHGVGGCGRHGRGVRVRGGSVHGRGVRGRGGSVRGRGGGVRGRGDGVRGRGVLRGVGRGALADVDGVGPDNAQPAEEIQWHAITENDFVLFEDFPFNETEGLSVRIKVNLSPIDFFELYITNTVQQLIVDESNRYAQQYLAFLLPLFLTGLNDWHLKGLIKIL